MTRKDSMMHDTPDAVEWFVLLRDCDDENVWIAHAAWLESDLANAAAYAAVEALWIDADELPDLPADARAADIVDLAAVRERRSRRSFAWIPVAAAAALVAMAGVPQIGGLFRPAGTIYRTGPTDIRRIALADGSRIVLNRNTELAVRMDDDERSVEMASGEATFDIAHDRDRPFDIAVADRNVRVLGTEFNVLDQDGAFGVTVRRGLVSVSAPGDPERAVRLPAGKALTRLPDAKADRIDSVDPDNVFAWRRGRLVYVDSPLAQVGRDLARYGNAPVRVSPDVRHLRVTGVIAIGSEADLKRQLELMLPIRIRRAADALWIERKPVR